MLGAVVAFVIMGSQLKAEEQAPTVADTLSAIGEGIQQAPAKIVGWAQSEWQEIKEFQAQGWADGKAQLNQDWQTIRGFFQTTESTN